MYLKSQHSSRFIDDYVDFINDYVNSMSEVATIYEVAMTSRLLNIIGLFCRI